MERKAISSDLLKIPPELCFDVDEKQFECRFEVGGQLYYFASVHHKLSTTELRQAKEAARSGGNQSGVDRRYAPFSEVEKEERAALEYDGEESEDDEDCCTSHEHKRHPTKQMLMSVASRVAVCAVLPVN